MKGREQINTAGLWEEINEENLALTFKQHKQPGVPHIQNRLHMCARHGMSFKDSECEEANIAHIYVKLISLNWPVRTTVFSFTLHLLLKTTAQ